MINFVQNYTDSTFQSLTQLTQNICITFVQRRPNVFDDPTAQRRLSKVLILLRGS